MEPVSRLSANLVSKVARGMLNSRQTMMLGCLGNGSSVFCGRLSRGFSSTGAKLDDETLATQIDKNYKALYSVYDKRPSCLNTYKKQLIFRSRNLGMKELDLLVGAWAAKHVPDLSYSECVRFEEEVLHMETPDLSQFLTEKVNDFEQWNFPRQHYLAKIKVFSDDPNWNSPK